MTKCYYFELIKISWHNNFNINSVENLYFNFVTLFLCLTNIWHYLHMKLRTTDDKVVSRTCRNRPGQLVPSSSIGHEPKVCPWGQIRLISPIHFWTNSSNMSLSKTANSCPRLVRYIGHIPPSWMTASWIRTWESKNIPLAWVPLRWTEHPTKLLFNSRAAAVPNMLFSKNRLCQTMNYIQFSQSKFTMA